MVDIYRFSIPHPPWIVPLCRCLVRRHCLNVCCSYSATVALCNGTAVPYYLDEATKWGLTVGELRQALAIAREQDVDTRALCIINPGNPTGACMTEENIRTVLQFAYDERLVLLVDEVYQVNCYDPEIPFISFRQVLATFPPAIADTLELFSFHSISKGVIGEVRPGFK